MTATTHDHAAIIRGITEQLSAVLDGSPQGIYIYLDDNHKVCNERLAQLLGYDSAADWSRPRPFTDYVDEASQRTLVTTYEHAMEHRAAGVIEVVWKRRDGGRQPSSVLLVPIAFGGELLALHFVTPH